VRTTIPEHQYPVAVFIAGLAVIDIEGREAASIVYASDDIPTPLLSGSFAEMLGFDIDTESNVIVPTRPYHGVPTYVVAA